MYETSDTVEGSPTYTKGDIVWVKLSSYWWPGEVINEEDLPDDLLSDFKKPPLVIVKFFDEDSYEYVKNWSNIYPYNCQKKNEFINKGMAGFRSKLSHMGKFPKDIGTAEERTNGNPNILSQPEFLPVKKINYDEIFGTPSPKKSSKGKVSLPSTKKTPARDSNQPHITHRRFLGNDDYRAYICIQYPGKDRKWDSDDEEIKKLNEEPEKVLTCQSCSFNTKRLEVMILHTKMHIQGIYISAKRKPKKTKDADASESDSDTTATKSPKPKQRKKKDDKPKTTDVFTNLLEEWDDTDEEMEEPKKKSPKAKKKTIREEKPLSEKGKNEEVHKDERNDVSTTKKVSESSETAESGKLESLVKNTQDDIKNCFDFDEEEEDDDLLLPTSTGRKIPRVIPEKPKPSISELLEQSQKEDELEKEKPSESIVEMEKPLESTNSTENETEINKKEILRMSQSFNREPSIDDNLENTFKELMADTELPTLDDLGQNLKPEQNFHDARTIKFPDKGGTTLKGGTAPKSGTSRKRFVTSFEDFEAGFRKIEVEERLKKQGGEKEVKTAETVTEIMPETENTNHTAVKSIEKTAESEENIQDDVKLIVETHDDIVEEPARTKETSAESEENNQHENEIIVETHDAIAEEPASHKEKPAESEKDNQHDNEIIVETHDAFIEKPASNDERTKEKLAENEENNLHDTKIIVETHDDIVKEPATHNERTSEETAESKGNNQDDTKVIIEKHDDIIEKPVSHKTRRYKKRTREKPPESEEINQDDMKIIIETHDQIVEEPSSDNEAAEAKLAESEENNKNDMKMLNKIHDEVVEGSASHKTKKDNEETKAKPSKSKTSDQDDTKIITETHDEIVEESASDKTKKDNEETKAKPAETEASNEDDMKIITETHDNVVEEPVSHKTKRRSERAKDKSVLASSTRRKTRNFEPEKSKESDSNRETDVYKEANVTSQDFALDSKQRSSRRRTKQFVIEEDSEEIIDVAIECDTDNVVVGAKELAEQREDSTQGKLGDSEIEILKNLESSQTILEGDTVCQEKLNQTSSNQTFEINQSTIEVVEEENSELAESTRNLPKEIVETTTNLEDSVLPKVDEPEHLAVQKKYLRRTRHSLINEDSQKVDKKSVEQTPTKTKRKVDQRIEPPSSSVEDLPAQPSFESSNVETQHVEKLEEPTTFKARRGRSRGHQKEVEVDLKEELPKSGNLELGSTESKHEVTEEITDALLPSVVSESDKIASKEENRTENHDTEVKRDQSTKVQQESETTKISDKLVESEVTEQLTVSEKTSQESEVTEQLTGSEKTSQESIAPEPTTSKKGKRRKTTKDRQFDEIIQQEDKESDLTGSIVDRVVTTSESASQSSENASNVPDLVLSSASLSKVDTPTFKSRRRRSQKYSNEEKVSTVVDDNIQTVPSEITIPDEIKPEIKEAKDALSKLTSSDVVKQPAQSVIEMHEEPSSTTRRGRSRKHSKEKEHHVVTVEDQTSKNLDVEPQHNSQLSDTMSMTDALPESVSEIPGELICTPRRGRSRKHVKEREQDKIALQENEIPVAVSPMKEPSTNLLVSEAVVEVSKSNSVSDPVLSKGEYPLKEMDEIDHSVIEGKKSTVDVTDNATVHLEQPTEESATSITVVDVPENRIIDIKPSITTSRKRRSRKPTQEEQVLHAIEKDSTVHVTDNATLHLEQSKEESAANITVVDTAENRVADIKLSITTSRKSRSRKPTQEEEQVFHAAEKDLTIDVTDNATLHLEQPKEESAARITVIDVAENQVTDIKSSISTPRKSRSRKPTQEEEQIFHAVEKDSTVDVTDNATLRLEQPKEESAASITVVAVAENQVTDIIPSISTPRKSRSRKSTQEEEQVFHGVEKDATVDVTNNATLHLEQPQKKSTASISVADVAENQVTDVEPSISTPRKSRSRKPTQEEKQVLHAVEERIEENSTPEPIKTEDVIEDVAGTTKDTYLEINQEEATTPKEEPIIVKQLDTMQKPEAIVPDSLTEIPEGHNVKTKRGRPRKHVKEDDHMEPKSTLTEESIVDSTVSKSIERDPVLETTIVSNFVNEMLDHPTAKSRKGRTKRHVKEEDEPAAVETEVKEAKQAKNKELQETVKRLAKHQNASLEHARSDSLMTMPEELFPRTRRGRSRKYTQEEEDFARAIEESLKDMAREREATLQQTIPDAEAQFSDAAKSTKEDPIPVFDELSPRSRKGKSRKRSIDKEQASTILRERRSTEEEDHQKATTSDDNSRNSVSESVLSNSDTEVYKKSGSEVKRRRSRASIQTFTALDENSSRSVGSNISRIEKDTTDLAEPDTVEQKQEISEQPASSTKRGRPRKHVKNDDVEETKNVEPVTVESLEIEPQIAKSQHVDLEPAISNNDMEISKQFTPKLKRGRPRKPTRDEEPLSTAIEETSSKITDKKQAEELTAALEFTKTVLELVENQHTEPKSDFPEPLVDKSKETVSIANDTQVDTESHESIPEPVQKEVVEITIRKDSEPKDDISEETETTEKISASETELVVEESHAPASKTRKRKSRKTTVEENVEAEEHPTISENSSLTPNIPFVETSEHSFTSEHDKLVSVQAKDSAGNVPVPECSETALLESTISDPIKVAEESTKKAKRFRLRKDIIDEKTENTIDEMTPRDFESESKFADICLESKTQLIKPTVPEQNLSESIKIVDEAAPKAKRGKSRKHDGKDEAPLAVREENTISRQTEVSALNLGLQLDNSQSIDELSDEPISLTHIEYLTETSDDVSKACASERVGEILEISKNDKESDITVSEIIDQAHEVSKPTQPKFDDHETTAETVCHLPDIVEHEKGKEEHAASATKDDIFEQTHNFGIDESDSVKPMDVAEESQLISDIGPKSDTTELSQTNILESIETDPSASDKNDSETTTFSDNKQLESITDSVMVDKTVGPKMKGKRGRRRKSRFDEFASLQEMETEQVISLPEEKKDMDSPGNLHSEISALEHDKFSGQEIEVSEVKQLELENTVQTGFKDSIDAAPESILSRTGEDSVDEKVNFVTTFEELIKDNERKEIVTENLIDEVDNNVKSSEVYEKIETTFAPVEECTSSERLQEAEIAKIIPEVVKSPTEEPIVQEVPGNIPLPGETSVELPKAIVESDIASQCTNTCDLLQDSAKNIDDTSISREAVNKEISTLPESSVTKESKNRTTSESDDTAAQVSTSEEAIVAPKRKRSRSRKYSKDSSSKSQPETEIREEMCESIQIKELIEQEIEDIVVSDEAKKSTKAAEPITQQDDNKSVEETDHILKSNITPSGRDFIETENVETLISDTRKKGRLRRYSRDIESKGKVESLDSVLKSATETTKDVSEETVKGKRHRKFAKDEHELLEESNIEESLEQYITSHEASKSVEEHIPRSKREKLKKYSKQESSSIVKTPDVESVVNVEQSLESSKAETAIQSINQEKELAAQETVDIVPKVIEEPAEEKKRPVPPKKNRWSRRSSYTSKKDDDKDDRDILKEQIIEPVVSEEVVIEEQIVEVNDSVIDTTVNETECVEDTGLLKKTDLPTLENPTDVMESTFVDLNDSEIILPPKKAKRASEVKFSFLKDSFSCDGTFSLEKKVDNDILSFPSCDDSIMSTSLRNNIEGLIKDIDNLDNSCVTDIFNKSTDSDVEKVSALDISKVEEVKSSPLLVNPISLIDSIKEPADMSKCVPPKKKKIEFSIQDVNLIQNDIPKNEGKLVDAIPQPPKKKIQKLFENSQALEKLGKVSDLPQMSPLAKKKSFLFHQEEFEATQKETEISQVASQEPQLDKVPLETDPLDNGNLASTVLSVSSSESKGTETIVDKSSTLPKKRKKRKSSSHSEHSPKKERRTSSEAVEQSDKNTCDSSNEAVISNKKEQPTPETIKTPTSTVSVPSTPVEDNLKLPDEHKNEMEVKLDEDDFKFCIQTNLSNLQTSAAVELSAIATETLSEIKNEVILESSSATPKENLESVVKKQEVIPSSESSESNLPAGIKVSDESEFIPLSLNPTVMSEKDLADAQVEITTDKVINEKKPTSLGMFSMDFLESGNVSKTISLKIKKKDMNSPKISNTLGTEFTSKAMTKEFDNRALITQPKAYALKSELLDILEGNSNSSTNSSGSEQKFKTSFDNYDKQTVVQGMFDFEEAIPSQIVLSNKVNPETVLMDSPKLLERLSMSNDAAKHKSKKVVIQSDIKVSEAVPKTIVTKITKPIIGTPKPGQKIVIKTTKTPISSVSKVTGSKPIILSEQIIRPANALKASKPSIQPQGLKRQYEDIEDVETAFIIPKIAKKSVEEEIVPVTPDKPPRARNTKGAGKAKILQQTIITPKGEIIQPQTPPTTKTTTPAHLQSAQSQPDDTVFDINSMPIVLSDDILTPESIQNMPVVLSEDVIPQSKPVGVKTEEKILPTLAKKIVSNVAPKQQIVFKTTPAGTVTPKQMTKPRILSNTPSSINKVAKPGTPALLATGTTADGKPTKYVLVPSTVTPTQVKTVKPPIIKKQPVQQTKVTSIQPSEPPSQVMGNKIMIVTNQHGQQTRVVLTPQQQKAFMQAQPGSKTKTIIKGAIPKALLESAAAAGPSGITPKTSIPSVPQGATPTVSSQGGLLMTVGRGVKAPIPPKKTTQKTVNKPQKTILIKNQMGQTVRKIQGTDDADLDRQVAEQLEAIKASARLQQANKSPEIINYTNRHIATTSTTNRMPVRKASSKKVEPIKVKPTVSIPLTQPQKSPETSLPALAPLSPQQRIPQVQSQTSPNLPKQALPIKVEPSATPSPVSKAVDAVLQQPVAVSTKLDIKTPITPLIGAENKPADRPLTQLVIQDGLGNQTTITEGQILAIPSETVDGQPQSYMLVTLDEMGNITPLNNEALMSLDPSLGLGGDLNNMVLQVDQGQGTVAAIKPSEQSTESLPVVGNLKQKKVEERLQPEPQKISHPVPEPKAIVPVEPHKSQQVPLAVEQQIVIGEGVLPGADAGGQQLIVTGDPIATQKFLESLSDGSTDLANILANAEGGSVLIQADGQQILIKTNTGSQPLLGIAESTEGGGNPIFGTHKPNQDILAAALANTDVFQPSDQPIVHSSPVKGLQASQLSPSGGSGVLYPMHVGNVLETSLTLNSPIMTPLEVPSLPSKKIDDEVDILNQVPKNVDLPITITDPNISQTVAQQQAIGLMELTLPISETTVSTDINSPSYTYSLSALDETVGPAQKPFNGSMPLLTEDVTEMDSSSSSQIGKIRVAKGLQNSESEFSSNFGSLPMLPETIESSREEVVKTSCFGEMGSLPMLTEDVIEDSGSSIGSSKPPRSSPKSIERDIVDEGLSTLGGEMCSSLSEPPPDMFDLASITPKEEEISSDISSIPEPEGETLSLHSENSGEIPIQPPIVANLNDLKRPGEEAHEQDEKRQKFD